jgi:hypothetical protein
MATNTPWGKSQNATKVERGLTFHSTSSHGGFLVSKGYAHKHLSPSALKRGEAWGNYYAFEEDCAATIVELELPATRVVFSNPENITDESLIKTLSRWYPDYLIERGVTPEPTAYARWNEQKEDERLRAERSPDLIVCAEGVDDNTVRVTTADRKEHLVTKESYQRREGLNLLSKCVAA